MNTPKACSSTRGMRTYLAGPMTGYPELNFPLFHAEAKRLRDSGHDVINPAELNADPSTGWGQCMRADIAQLVTCQAIAMLPGWQDSRGATLEYHIATQLGMQVIDLAPTPISDQHEASAADLDLAERLLITFGVLGFFLGLAGICMAGFLVFRYLLSGV